MAANRARVSSVLEVKADWQVELDPADTWESMTRDEAKMKEIMPGLQQVVSFRTLTMWWYSISPAQCRYCKPGNDLCSHSGT